MKNKKSGGFTLIELLIVISVLGLLASLVLVWMGTVRAQSRDAQRVAETDALRKALEMYYDEHGDYPLAATWVKIEENPTLAGDLKPWLPKTPGDPLYPKEDGSKIYSYQYQSTPDQQGYKIHVEMETGKFTTYQYEVVSGGGGGITYGGGPGGGVLPAGYALRFDGTDDFTEVADESGVLNVTNTLSVEAWIRPKTVAAADNWRTIIGKQVGNGVSGNEGYSLFVDEDQNTLYFHVSMAQGHIYTSYALPALDTWYHVVGTFQPGPVINLYVDGELKNNVASTYGAGPFTGPIGSSSRPLNIGGDPFNDSLAPREFDGSVDEVRVYSRVLSPAEADEHFKGIFNNNTGLAGLWSFEEGAGTVAADSSGNGNYGILFNPPSDYALQFNGTNGYVNVASSSSLNISGEITIETWIKRDSVSPTPDWRTIIEKEPTSESFYAGEPYILLADTDQKSVYFALGDEGDYMQYFSPETMGEWQHIVSTFSPSNIAMYVDYGLNAVDPVGGSGIMSTSSKPLFIGGDPLNRGYAYYEFDGLIGEIRLYAKALPANVIKKHFEGDYSIDNTGCGGDCDLRAYWKMDEGSGTSTADTSGKGNNGNILNDVQWTSLSSLNTPQWFLH